MLREDNLDLSRLIRVGLRPVKMEVKSSNISEAYALVPTRKGEWIRKLLEESQWEGSHIPLVVYNNNEIVIMAPHTETNNIEWQIVKQAIQLAINREVTIRGD